MSDELSLMEEDTTDVDIWQYLNETVCDIPELENMTGIENTIFHTVIILFNLLSFSELQMMCHERRGGGGGVSTLPPYVMIIIQIFYALVCLCGLVGNSLVIYVVLRYSSNIT